MFEKILVLCHANICRSPVAERMLANRLSDSPISVQSAGIEALEGKGAAEAMQQIAETCGFSLADHRARQVDGSLARWADLILVMEEEQKRFLECAYPDVCGKVFLLSRWDDGCAISDPYRKSFEDYERSFKRIETCVASWVAKLNALEP